MLTKTLTIAILFSLFFAWTGHISASTSTAYDKYGLSSAMLDASSGKLLAGKDQNRRLPLASLTKLITAIVLLDIGVNLDKKVTITKAQIDYVSPYIDAGDITSSIDLRAGDRVRLRDLWNAMLVSSSNEAAIALADNSGLTRKQFVKRMNAKAKAYGLKQTVFTEPSGIDPANLGTAKEMAIIARRAYRTPAIRLSGIQESYSFREIITGRRISASNRNSSLLAMDPLGMKVGYLYEARMNVALRLRTKNKDRIIIVLHAPNNAARNQEINRLRNK